MRIIGSILRNNRRRFWEILNRIIGRKNRIIGTGLAYCKNVVWLVLHLHVSLPDQSKKAYNATAHRESTCTFTLLTNR